MTTRNQWIIGIGSALTLFGIVVFIDRKYFATSPFKSRLKKVALGEYGRWDKGNIKESSPAMLDTLQKYWKEGAGVGYTGKTAQDEAWSAAYISYVMKQAGAGNLFPYSASHSVYITQAIKNRKENNKNPFKGYKPEEQKLAIGDLVCSPRQAGVTYDTSAPGYISHCDLVIDVDKKTGIAKAIGGNVSNSVAITNVPITSDGKIDMSKQKKGYFVVIKNGK